MRKNFCYWAKPVNELFEWLESKPEGLSPEEAARRKNLQNSKRNNPLFKDLILFFSQFRNPLTLLLIFALLLSSLLGEFVESSIIFGILFFSGVLSFFQERKAGKAAETIRRMVRTKARVCRNNQTFLLPIEEIVPGDVVFMEAGDIVPGDGVLLGLKDLYINEAVMTGESFPAEKKLGLTPEDTALARRKNAVFKGTSVISGTGVALMVQTGSDSELGEMERRLSGMTTETAFEKDLRRFGYMLMRVALILAGAILIVNIELGKNPLDSILFALALSLGLTPEMLPAIVTITLSSSAKRLSSGKVIVKRLASIQNLGAIDVLCSDKTGTLTEGEVRIHSYSSLEGRPDPKIKKYAYLNALFESGYPNPIDEAIRKQLETDVTGFEKFDEVPYDFIRKRLSIVVSHENQHILITKGALQQVLEICSSVILDDGTSQPLEPFLPKLEERYGSSSAQGFRTIGIAFKDVTGDPLITKEDENNLTFLGFLLLYDPPKEGIEEVIRELKAKKIDLKIITGDNVLVAKNLAIQIGIPPDRIITGKELHTLSDDAIGSKVQQVDLFAETEPSQKERIIRALQRKGHVVGYLGDGINDAMALKASDVGISVNNAADVAKDSADLILLEKALGVISQGITEGRKTYLNTLKYIFITISANFGNMISMAGMSLVLPFLPLLPCQILLTNFLSDIPALSVASDSVDEEMLRKPRRWDSKLIRRFMVVFGLESSIFDFLSFGVLLWIFHASPERFRTGWFIESILSEICILLIIRTRRSFLRSKASAILLRSSAIVALVTLITPYLPWSKWIGLQPLPLPILLTMLLIVLCYSATAEFTKKILFTKMHF